MRQRSRLWSRVGRPALEPRRNWMRVQNAMHFPNTTTRVADADANATWRQAQAPHAHILGRQRSTHTHTQRGRHPGRDTHTRLKLQQHDVGNVFVIYF